MLHTPPPSPCSSSSSPDQTTGGTTKQAAHPATKAGLVQLVKTRTMQPQRPAADQHKSGPANGQLSPGSDPAAPEHRPLCAPQRSRTLCAQLRDQARPSCHDMSVQARCNQHHTLLAPAPTQATACTGGDQPTKVSGEGGGRGQ